MNKNEIIKKAVGAITSSAMNEILLNKDQFEEFLLLFNQSAVLRPLVRQEIMPEKQMEIPRLFLYEPVAEGAQENTSSGTVSRPSADSLGLIASKVAAKFHLPYDVLVTNVQKKGFEDTIVSMITNRFGIDIEDLALNGDVSLAGATDRRSKLLATKDGWSKQADSGRTIDWRSQPVSKAMFKKALRALPDVYKSSSDLAWIVSTNLMNDWKSLVAERATTAGDEALGTKAILGPFGIPMIGVPLIPDDLPLQLTTGLPAELKGSAFGPFEITTGVNDTLIININGLGNRNIVFLPGTYQTVVIANAINAVLQANGDPAIAADDGEGRLVIRTLNAGAANNITIQSGSTAALTLGIQGAGLPNQVAGVDPGTAGQIREGSYMFLTSRSNLIWGIFDEVRMSRQYNQDFDRFEFAMYAYFDFKIENLDAIVKVYNIKVESVF